MASEYEEMMNVVNNVIDDLNDVEERVTALEENVSDPSPSPNETPEQKRIREREERVARLKMSTAFRDKDGLYNFTAMSSGLGGIKGRLSRRKSLRKMSRSRRKSYSKMPLSLRRRKMPRSRRKTYKMF